MSFNTFGKIFRFTTWGESHGAAIGCIIDGCPPNIPLSEKDIQKDMDRRRPGQSKFTTQRKAGSSCGAIIELRATGVPVGLGAPIYSKLDTDIAAALMSINAVKGVNIGAGMNAAFLSGEENSDEMNKISGKINFKSNQAGGILGGISSGQNIVASFAVKPTSSILTSRNTIDKKGKNTKISVRGRHDPCVGIRAVPIGEAMINCVLLDHFLMHRAQCG